MRILHVDDQQLLRDSLRKKLESQGHKVDSCESAHDAAELLISKLFAGSDPAFDLVITDFNMPDHNGDVVVEMFNVYQPDTPVVVWTADVDRASRSCSSFEARFCGKGDLEELLEIVGSVR